MDGEVIYPLFSLFQQRIAERFPGEIFGDPVYLLQRLIDRHRADRHRAVTQDPLAGFVDIAPGGEIHHRVRAPAGGPHQFFDLFFDGRGDRRVANIGVHFHQEVAANNHRFRFRVVYVGRDNRSASGHFVTHEFRRDVLRQASAKTFARMLVAQNFAANALAPHVFADGDEFHLRRYDPLACIVQLGHTFSRFRPFRRQQTGETQPVQTVVRQTLFGVRGAAVGQ
ncbi:hypothetical protein D3C72_788330 [compost metagenome]